MTKPMLFALAACLIACGAARGAVDLTKIERKILHEPRYETRSPGYCLLVFGPEAKSRMWLVIDGEKAYLDEDGDRDLTDPDEAHAATRGYWNFATVREQARPTTHSQLKVWIQSGRKLRLSINLAEGCRQTVGYGKSSYARPVLGDRPEEAPIIHLNGPMTFARYGPVSFLPRNAEGKSFRQTYLRLFIGSPGLGEGTFAGYNCKALKVGSSYRSIVAEVEFANKKKGAPPITLRDHLKVRG